VLGFYTLSMATLDAEGASTTPFQAIELAVGTLFGDDPPE
jgi:hypothetical protein